MVGDEYFDLVDADNRPLGFTKLRSRVHREGDWHRAILVWVWDRSGRVLLQRRAHSKDLYGGTWAVAVGGHVPAGSDYLETAVREFQEELGWAIQPIELVFLQDVRYDGGDGALIDREHLRVYGYELPIEPDRLRPDPEEVEGLHLFDRTEVTRLWQEQPEQCSPSLGTWPAAEDYLSKRFGP